MDYSLLFCLLAVLVAVNAESSCPEDEYCLQNQLNDGLYINPKSVHFYISCSDTLTYCMPCPRNMVWNDKVKRCGLPSAVENQKSKAHCPKDFCKDKKDGDFGIPDSFDQHYFAKCFQHITYCFKCPVNLEWSKKLHRCDWPTVLSSNTNKSHCAVDFCKGKKDGDYANPAKMDQHYFIKCVANITYCFHCPAGLVWNEKEKRCDYPPKSDTNDKSHCAVNYCKDKKDGDYANPPKMDQHYFIKCSNHFTFCFHCPDGLIWNDKIKRCDHPKQHKSYKYIKF